MNFVFKKKITILTVDVTYILFVGVNFHTFWIFEKIRRDANLANAFMYMYNK